MFGKFYPHGNLSIKNLTSLGRVAVADQIGGRVPGVSISVKPATWAVPEAENVDSPTLMKK